MLYNYTTLLSTLYIKTGLITAFLLAYSVVKMKSFYNLTIFIAFWSYSISARSTSTPRITVTITNELDNQEASASIPGDGRFRRVPDLFANTDLDQNGQFFGTSAQLSQSVDDASCIIRSNIGDLLLNSSTPLVDLDGNPNVALLKPLVLNGVQILCRS
jgi:hypothetical protein